MKFKYLKYSLKDPLNKNKFLYRPIIPLSISNISHSVHFEALIDSGADFSIFPEEIAEKINISPKNKEKIYFSGIGDIVNEGFIAQVYLTVGKNTVKTKVIFSSALDASGVLGQYGFFDKFLVKFDLTGKEIDILPRK